MPADFPEPWDRTGCSCAPYRKPCAYHEGAEDALDRVEALRDDAIAERDRARAIAAALEAELAEVRGDFEAAEADAHRLAKAVWKHLGSPHCHVGSDALDDALRQHDALIATPRGSGAS